MTQTPTAPILASPPAAPGQPQYLLTQADKDRQKNICAAWKAFEGELEKPLARQEDEPDDNVLTNEIEAFVERGADFLFGQELEITAEKDAPAEAQQVLDGVWGRKEKRIPLLLGLFMNGAMAGNAFIRIMKWKQSWRLIALDPAIVFAQTAPGDCETVFLWCTEYCSELPLVDQKGKPLTMYYHEEITPFDASGQPITPNTADQIASWQVQHWTRIGDKGDWTAAGDPIAWPYEFAPIFACQNLPRPNKFWGKPDVTPNLIGINDAINLIQSWINRVLKLYGAPILYAPGTGEATIDIEPGKIIQLPLAENVIKAVEIVSDLASALNFLANLRGSIDTQTSVPAVALGRLAELPRGAVSGIAIALMFLPLVKKTDKKRCLYGDLIITVSQALLVLAGMSGDIDITLGWQSPLPDDNLQDLQGLLVKRELGVSKATALREAGYDPEQEAELNKEEATQQVTDFSRGQGLPPQVGTMPAGLPGVPPLPGQTPPTVPGAPGDTVPAAPAKGPDL